jgi:hypothetical protein
MTNFSSKKYLSATIETPKEFWMGVGIAVSRKMPNKVKVIIPIVADLLQLLGESVHSLFTDDKEEKEQGIFSLYDFYELRTSRTKTAKVWLETLGEKRPFIHLLNLAGPEGMKMAEESLKKLKDKKHWTAEKCANIGMDAWGKIESANKTLEAKKAKEKELEKIRMKSDTVPSTRLRNMA